MIACYREKKACNFRINGALAKDLSPDGTDTFDLGDQILVTKKFGGLSLMIHFFDFILSIINPIKTPRKKYMIKEMSPTPKYQIFPAWSHIKSITHGADAIIM